jgi:hypothetical protein
MLCASMLSTLDVPVEFVTIAADPQDPTRFSHVYCYAVLEDGSLLAMDCSHGTRAGWEAPRAFRRQRFPILLASPLPEQMAAPRMCGLPAGISPIERSVLYGPQRRPRVRRGIGNQGIGNRGIGDVYSDAGVDPNFTGTQISSGNSFNWSSLLSAGLADTTSILKEILPITLAPSTGTVQTNAAGGVSVTSGLPGALTAAAGAVSSTTLMLGLGALLVIVLIAGKR